MPLSVCTDASLELNRRNREARHARTLANGGIAVDAKVHNRRTYANWRCRCEVCVADKEAHRSPRKKR